MPDHDLAVIGIGRRQLPVEVAEQGQGVPAIQAHQPWLTIVRIGRKDRIGQGTPPELGFLPGFAPRCPCRARRAIRRDKASGPCRRQHDSSPNQFQHAAPCCHRPAPYLV